MFTEEKLGPFQTKEEAVNATNERLDTIADQIGNDEMSEFEIDRRSSPPNNGLLLIATDAHDYHFHISTKEPREPNW